MIAPLADRPIPIAAPASGALDAAVARARESLARAAHDVDLLARAAADQEGALRAALAGAARTAGLAAFDPALLEAFFARPYLVQPVAPGVFDLIVPRFVGLRAGWPVRETETYAIYRVTRLTRLLAPLPAPLAGELGFGPPDFRAVLEGLALTVTAGDAAAVARALGGSRHIARREGGTLWLRPASRFQVLRQIIREQGFLPYEPAPVPAALRRPPALARDEEGAPALALRPHQRAAWERFLELGAVSLLAPPQTGKTMVALMACAALAGRKLILVPRRALAEQWRARLDLTLEPAAAREVTVATYQSARKFFDGEFSLVAFDEGHHAPADFAIEAATALRTATRLLLSSTPFRENGHEELIVALGGFPVGADWPTAARRPGVVVWLARDEDDKLRLARAICARPVPGRTLVFTQRLALGERLAAALGAPFVHGKTRDQRRRLEEGDLVVASSIADEGLSLGLARVVEVDFLWGSRAQAGQRVGRLFGSDAATEYHVLMTPAELAAYGKRLLVYQQWGLELTFRGHEGADARVAGDRPRASARVGPARPRRVGPPAADGAPDFVATLRALPPVAAKLAAAEGQLGPKERGYLPRVLRLLARTPLRPAEIAEAWGLGGTSTARRIEAACRALAGVGLLAEDGDGRLRLDEAEVARLRSLAEAADAGR